MRLSPRVRLGDRGLLIRHIVHCVGLRDTQLGHIIRRSFHWGLILRMCDIPSDTPEITRSVPYCSGTEFSQPNRLHYPGSTLVWGGMRYWEG
jgi:hypothetical protein